MSPTSGAVLPADLAQRFEVVAVYTGGEGWSGLVREPDGTGSVLKILEAGADLTEASLLASLRHPRIPAILEVGRTDDGRAFLRREHVEGEALQACLPLPADAVLELAVQLLEVLAFVHLRGVLHLDVKPANVVRSGTPETPLYSLLDFGLGARRGGEARGGTPVFCAPERLLGLPADPRSDLFSLGALVLVALRGPRALAARRFLAEFPRRDFFAAAGVDRSELPAPFDNWLPRLLARRPAARYGDAQEALEALTGCSSGRPSAALLRPDVIALHGDAVARFARTLPADADPTIEGGDLEDRRMLALHAATALGDVTGVREEAGGTRLLRGGTKTARFALAALDATQTAAHLQRAAGLDDATARAAALHLHGSGPATPGAIGAVLERLVEEARIVPDGTRWIWPDAIAGRLDLTPLPSFEPTPAAIRDAAAHGHLERALRAYRAVGTDLPADAERELRAALADGLLRGGQPARALPFAGDLPVLRARALIDLGRIAQARAQLQMCGDDDDHDQIEHVLACIDCASGDLDAAEQRLRGLLARAPRAEHGIVLGLVLTMAGRTDAAISLLQDAAASDEVRDNPFLLAATLTNLHLGERARGDLAAAQEHLERALELHRSLGHVRHAATTSSNLGVLAKDRGDFAAAREHLRRAQSLFEHVQDRTGATLAAANLGIVALASGDATAARRRLEAALQELDALGAGQARALITVMLARAHAELGERDAARQRLAEAGPLREKRLRDEADAVRDLLEHGSQPPPTMPDADTPEPPLTRRDSIPKEVFRTFLAINRRLAGEADLQRAMSYLLDAAVTLTGGRLGYLLLSREGGVRIEVSSAETGAALAFSRSIVNRAMQTGRVLTAEDALADRELVDMRSVRDLQQRSAVCVPFVAASGTRGALYVEHPSRAGVFDDAAKEHLEALADQAAIAVDRLLHEEALAAELQRSRRDLAVVKRSLRPAKHSILGSSQPIEALRRQIEKVADSGLPILILGDSGTGKELVARALHDNSPRRDREFVALNCSAIPAELMESELFGHARGAFTGAVDEQTGLLELASGGTLFLDEIGDMPLPMQAKLLRVLQEQVVQPIGGRDPIRVDLRVVAATHKDLRAAIEAGTFREDLYYRLAAVELRVPPLRERGGDILLLAEAFLAQLNSEHRRDVRLTDAARASLARYPWPGNVRELQHVIARAFLLSDDGELRSLHLPPVHEPTEDGHPWPVLTLQEAEARTIRAALESTGGDKTKAARVLGISRTALYEKLKRIEQRGEG